MPAKPALRSVVLMLVVSVIAAAPGLRAADAPQVDLSTPEGTSKTVAAAVHAKDLAAYRQCFTPGALESGEAMIARLERSPDATWARLQDIFRGPQKITETSRSEAYARLRVEAPESPGGGIGTVSLEKIDGAWKIANW